MFQRRFHTHAYAPASVHASKYIIWLRSKLSNHVSTIVIRTFRIIGLVENKHQLEIIRLSSTYLQVNIASNRSISRFFFFFFSKKCINTNSPRLKNLILMFGECYAFFMVRDAQHTHKCYACCAAK